MLLYYQNTIMALAVIILMIFVPESRNDVQAFKLASVALITQIQHISLIMKCMHGLSSTYDHNQTIPITSFTSNKTIGA